MTEPTKDVQQQDDDAAASLTMLGSIQKGIIGLGLFAVVTAGMIALTQQMTAETIQHQIALARSKALYEIVPAREHNNAILDESFTIDARALGLSKPEDAYVAKKDGQPVSVILPVVAPEGYSGPIKLIVGIQTNGQIKGVRVVEHRETPGLGDKIEIQKSDWIKSFSGLSFANTPIEQWKVKKDGGSIDQLTGATVTPRAITNAIRDTLHFFETHKGALLAQSPQQLFIAPKDTNNSEDGQE